jgi:hypothetical protein
MGSGFATIPQIDASVPVQATSSRVARGVLPAAQPEQLRQAAQGVGEIGRILQVQYEHKQILDAETVADGVRNKFTELRAKNADLPGDQQASTFQQQSNEIVKAAIDDPANGHIKDYLQHELVKQQNEYYRDSIMAGIAKTAQEHFKQVDKGGKQTAIIAGADYVAKPDGTFSDGPTAQAVEQKHFNTIDALYGRNPEIANELKDTYQQQKIFERAQAIALNDPKNLTAFLKSPQSAEMGQGAKTTLLLKSLQIQDLAEKKVNVDMNNLEAQTFNKFLSDKATGTLDENAVVKARDAQLLKGDHAEFLVGHPIQAPETPTDPAVKADVEARTASAPSAFALDALAASLSGKRGLTESDRAIQRDKIEKQKALLETPVKQAEDRYKADLRTYYEPTTGAERRDRHGVLKNATTLGDAMWEAGVSEIKAKGGSPEQQTTALLRLKADVMKAHQKPTGEALRGETMPVPTTSAVPPGVPALSPEEIMNHGRSLAP